MYGYYTTHYESIIDKIVSELDAIYHKLFDLSVQKAIDMSYYIHIQKTE